MPNAQCSMPKTRIEPMEMTRLVVAVGAVLGLVAGTPGAQGLTKAAELAKRGLTAADFPRLINLAEDVYA